MNRASLLQADCKDERLLIRYKVPLSAHQGSLSGLRYGDGEGVAGSVRPGVGQPQEVHRGSPEVLRTLPQDHSGGDGETQLPGEWPPMHHFGLCG